LFVGVKSILDIPATLERLDSLGVPVVGFETDRFPGFYLHDSGSDLEWTFSDEEVSLERFGPTSPGVAADSSVARSVGADQQLDPDLHAEALRVAFERADSLGVSGKDVTPVLLAAFADVTGGASVAVNRALVVGNAALAGRTAAALAALWTTAPTPRLLVVGDLMVDVIVRPRTEVAPTSDTDFGDHPRPRWLRGQSGGERDASRLRGDLHRRRRRRCPRPLRRSQ
jgi:hypothetical protein